MKRNRISLLLLVPLLVSCDSNKHKIAIDYSDLGGLKEVSLTKYQEIFMLEKNVVSFISIKDNDYCSSCYGGSLTDLDQYAIDNHFDIYHLIFDYESESFIDDYNNLAKFMAQNNDNGIEEITKYQDDLPIISSLPCLILSNSGYIGYNVNDNFIGKLKETIYVTKKAL